MKSWAMVVGINRYPPSAAQSELHGAVADACDFAEWALHPDGGGVLPEHLFFWTHPWPTPAQDRLTEYLSGPCPTWSTIGVAPAGPLEDRPPCAFEITGTFDELGRKLAGEARTKADNETRRAYVFLAGHGVCAMTVDHLEETCFVAADARPSSGDLAVGMVPCDTFRRALLNNRFDEAVVFTDCCRTRLVKTSIVVQKVSDARGTPVKPYAIGFAAQDDAFAHDHPSRPDSLTSRPESRHHLSQVALNTRDTAACYLHAHTR